MILAGGGVRQGARDGRRRGELSHRSLIGQPRPSDCELGARVRLHRGERPQAKSPYVTKIILEPPVIVAIVQLIGIDTRWWKMTPPASVAFDVW